MMILTKIIVVTLSQDTYARHETAHLKLSAECQFCLRRTERKKGKSEHMRREGNQSLQKQVHGKDQKGRAEGLKTQGQKGGRAGLGGGLTTT